MILFPIVDGRCTGIVDEHGNMIHDGDRVWSFNLMAEGEVYEDIRAGYTVKQGVPCTVRLVLWDLLREGPRFGWVVMNEDGGTTGMALPGETSAPWTQLMETPA